MGTGRRKLMRIDRARAMETIETTARLEGKDEGAELELTQLITARLEQTGWDVEQREVIGSASAVLVRRSLAYVMYGLTGAVVLLLARSGFWTFWSLLVCGLAVAGWLLLLTNLPRGRWLLPPLGSARLLIAKKPSSGQGLSRVVIRVALDPGSGPRDGAGIALLLELARGWARHPPARVETVFAFVGGQDLDRAGDWALAELLTKEPSDKPTLLLTLDAPGIGKELLIHDDGRLVWDAAESLWVPHRVPTFRESRRVSLLPLQVADSEVWLGGSASYDVPQEVDLEAMARTAQLVEEAVLRWGKRYSGATEANQPADERTASRSLQKPG
jgi:hypothetical protein